MSEVHVLSYQSFDGEKSDSRSREKLEKLALPSNLTGKTLLDIGCNEGFFCKVALERGAKRVLGIDINPTIIEKAKVRLVGAEFRVSSWWDLPNEKFDYILFLSAIHYEPEQKKLLNLIRSRLSSSGKLILECGAIWDLDRKDWKIAQRHDGMLKFPTARLLMEDLLEGYAVRDIGPSIEQLGDPIRRYVFHCTPALPTIFLIGGVSNRGKTTFSRLFAKRGVRTLNTDFMLGALMKNTAGLRDPFVVYLSENLRGGQIDVFFRQLVFDKKEDQYCSFLLRHVSKDDEITVVEGFAFSLPEVLESFDRLAKAKGFKVISTTL